MGTLFFFFFFFGGGESQASAQYRAWCRNFPSRFNRCIFCDSGLSCDLPALSVGMWASYLWFGHLATISISLDEVPSESYPVRWQTKAEIPQVGFLSWALRQSCQILNVPVRWQIVFFENWGGGQSSPIELQRPPPPTSSPLNLTEI